jgi:RimJ/RimL family protein N-acetyltransferase
VTAIEPVEIAAGRFQLRPPSPSESADALAMLLDPDIEQWNPGPDRTRLDLAEAEAWCRRGADWSDGSHATFSILEATTGRLLGNVSLHKIDREQRDGEIGYRVAPWARGQGVATAGLVAVSRWAFGALDLVRLEAYHAVANVASCRVAEKAGFRWEGTLRQSYVYGDGQRCDEHLHARLASDPDRLP